MKCLIRGGRVIDPSQRMDGRFDLLIEGDRFAGLLSSLESKVTPVDRTIEVDGMVVAPGLIDLHAHLREPGQTEKEDIESGTHAAVSGGFTSILAMPNTFPPNDSVETTKQILRQTRKKGWCRVYPVGAVSRGLKGEELSPLEDLKKAGCVAFSDDGRPINDARLMRAALTQTKALQVPLIEHCEELSLSPSPTLHDGAVAAKWGAMGVPVSAETVDMVRTLVIAAELEAPIHIAHLSAAASVDLIREFKKHMKTLTAEVTPHHLMLTDEAVERFGANAKMYPPLRSERDRTALRRGWGDGTLDVVATDHAPHTVAEKSLPFAETPNGLIGLETALPLLLTLVDGKEITLSRLIQSLSTIPAKIAGIEGGTLKKGAPADFVIFSPDEPRTISEGDFFSKSKNSPFLGFQCKGRVHHTWVGGREVFPKRSE